MSKPKPLLRRSKYYVKAINGACANCKRGVEGCCQPGLRFTKKDFQMDFTSMEEVRALFETGIFHLSVHFNSESRRCIYATIRIRGAIKDRRNICVFWTEKGCRLIHSVRPKVCRTHLCWTLDSEREKLVKEVNVRNKIRSNRPHDSEWTKDEVITLLRVAAEIKFGIRNLSAKAFKKLDWDSILTVLQGRP